MQQTLFVVLFVGGLPQAFGKVTTADEVRRYVKKSGQAGIEAHGVPTPVMGPSH